MWHAQVMNIKAVIADITQSIQSRNGSTDDLEETDRVNYNRWLNTVYLFVRRYGRNGVPGDIKHAANSVEEGIGMPITEWQN